MSKTTWRVGHTSDQVLTHDDIPLGRVREQMRRDAARWGRQGLTFAGVAIERDPHCRATSGCGRFVVTANVYELRTTSREGFWLVDALAHAAREDWTEINDQANPVDAAEEPASRA